MQVLEVREAVLGAAERIRSGEGPFFMEAVTYRFQGHSMADPVSYREREETEGWRDRDPIVLLRSHLVESGQASGEDIERLEREATATVDDAVAFAESSPEPALSELFTHIHAEPDGAAGASA